MILKVIIIRKMVTNTVISGGSDYELLLAEPLSAKAASKHGWKNASTRSKTIKQAIAQETSCMSNTGYNPI